jgi:RHS repeat-associated protein
MYFTETDHLGSIIGLLRTDGTVQEQYSYDPWGRRRNPVDWSYNNVSTTFLIDRGFTGHEHLDKLGLINMNGRIYDPVLGRFLSADPVIQSPYFSQSFNGYSYCFNNPLKYIDPSGYSAYNAYYSYIEAQYQGYGGTYFEFSKQYFSDFLDNRGFQNNDDNGNWIIGSAPKTYTYTWQERVYPPLPAGKETWDPVWKAIVIPEVPIAPPQYITHTTTITEYFYFQKESRFNNSLDNISKTQSTGTIINTSLNIATNQDIPGIEPKFRPKGYNPSIEADVAKALKVSNKIVRIVGKPLGLISVAEHGIRASQAFNNDQFWKGIGYTILTGFDIALFAANSNPFILAGSFIYGVLDATAF